MTDADKVAQIERAAELELLEQLLREKRRPVPPAPRSDPQIRQLMQAIARTLEEVA